jgi:hypothetical protein
MLRETITAAAVVLAAVLGAVLLGDPEHTVCRADQVLLRLAPIGEAAVRVLLGCEETRRFKR